MNENLNLLDVPKIYENQRNSIDLNDRDLSQSNDLQTGQSSGQITAQIEGLIDKHAKIDENMNEGEMLARKKTNFRKSVAFQEEVKEQTLITEIPEQVQVEQLNQDLLFEKEDKKQPTFIKQRPTNKRREHTSPRIQIPMNQPLLIQENTNPFQNRTFYQNLKNKGSISPERPKPIQTVFQEGGPPQPLFNFDHYQFYNPQKSFRHTEYLEELMKENKVNKKKIRKSMMELVFVQVVSRLNNEFPSLPSYFHDNKQKWSFTLLKTKPFQDIFIEFTSKIATLIEKEVHKNRQQLSIYLTHPRIFKSQVEYIKPAKVNPDIKIHDIGSFNFKEGKGAKKGVNKQNFNQALNTQQNLNQNQDEQTPNRKKGSFNFQGAAKGNFKQGIISEKDKQEISVIKAEYKKIMDKVKDIDKIIDHMEDNTNELGQDIMEFEQDFQNLEKEASSLAPPLIKITDMLERWHKEPIHTQDEITKFANELWFSLAEYEKEMKESIKGHEIILAMKEYKYMNHVEWIKNKFGFYVELYEVNCIINKSYLQQAFIELKLRQRREVERLQMSLCENESRLMNYQKDDSEIAKIIYEDTPKFRQAVEAYPFINDLKKAMSSMHYEMKQLKIENNDYKNQIAQLETTKSDLLEQMSQWQYLFSYYQSICIKVAKELDLLNQTMNFDIRSELSPLQQQEQINKLKNIEKFKGTMELPVQDEIIKTLEDQVRFNYVLNQTVQNYKLINEAVTQVYHDLIRTNVIPQFRMNNTKKTSFDQNSVTIQLLDEDRQNLYTLFEGLQKKTNQSFEKVSNQAYQQKTNTQQKQQNFQQKNNQGSQSIDQKQNQNKNQDSSIKQKNPLLAPQSNTKDTLGQNSTQLKDGGKSNQNEGEKNKKKQDQKNSQTGKKISTQKNQSQKKAVGGNRRRSSINESVKAGSDVQNQTPQGDGLLQNQELNGKDEKIAHLIQVKSIVKAHEVQVLNEKYQINEIQEYQNQDLEDQTNSLLISEFQAQDLKSLVKQCLTGKTQQSKENQANDQNSSFESIATFIDIHQQQQIQIPLDQFIEKINKVIAKKLFRSGEKKQSEQSIYVGGGEGNSQEKFDDQEQEGNEGRTEKKIEEEAKIQSDKQKVPLGDCLQLEYNENCELIGFSIRPKLASFLYWRDNHDTRSLREILKVVIYMNRLLKTYEIDPSSNPHQQDRSSPEATKQALSTRPEENLEFLLDSPNGGIQFMRTHHAQPLYTHYHKESAGSHLDGMTESELGHSRNPSSMQYQRNNSVGQTLLVSQRPLGFSQQEFNKKAIEMKDQACQVRVKKLLKHMGVDSQTIINMLKYHLIDIICRISPYQRDKMKTLFFSEEMCDDECQPVLMGYPIKGVQIGTNDINFGDYLKLILDQIIKRIKSIPPAKRKVLNIKDVLLTLDQIDESKIDRDYLYSKNSTKSTEQNNLGISGHNPLKRATIYSGTTTVESVTNYNIPIAMESMTVTVPKTLPIVQKELKTQRQVTQKSVSISLIGQNLEVQDQVQIQEQINNRQIETQNKNIIQGNKTNFPETNLNKDQEELDLFPSNLATTINIATVRHNNQISLTNSNNWLQNTFSSTQHQHLKPKSFSSTRFAQGKGGFFTQGTGLVQNTKQDITNQMKQGINQTLVLNPSQETQDRQSVHSRNFTKFLINQSIQSQVNAHQANNFLSFSITSDTMRDQQNAELASSQVMDRRNRRQQSQQNPFHTLNKQNKGLNGLLLQKNYETQGQNLVISLDQKIQDQSYEQRKNSKQRDAVHIPQKVQNFNDPMFIISDSSTSRQEILESKFGIPSQMTGFQMPNRKPTVATSLEAQNYKVLPNKTFIFEIPSVETKQSDSRLSQDTQKLQ